MKEPRNPFRIRMSQRVESDVSFLRMFGAGVLDVLPQDDLWGRVQIFQSAPGGGKTSLLRAFTPSVLLALHELRGSRAASGGQLRDLYAHMERLGAMNDSGPSVLGIMPSNAANYAILEDSASFDPAQKERLFYSLFNARVIKSALRGALILQKAGYPDGLKRVTVLVPSNVDLPPLFPLPCSGDVLYEWAQQLELSICKAMDDFGPPRTSLEGHDSLHALEFLRPDCILFDGKPVAEKVTIMLDDFHLLAAAQRRKFRSKIFTLRVPIGVWLAERLEALEPKDLLDDRFDATIGREYSEIRLESYWRERRGGRAFETFVTNIANLRVHEAEDVRSQNLTELPFADYLEDSLDSKAWQPQFHSAASAVAGRIKEKAQNTHLYDEWIASRETNEGTAFDQAVAWRQLEIMMARQDNKPQKSLDLGMPLSEEELKDEADERHMAEYFLAREFDLPYYFGTRRLARLSSYNIEQFLALGSELFEEITAAALVRKSGPSPMLSPKRQETILQRAVKERWQDIPRREGREAQKFLEALGHFAQRETHRPAASYLAVTGFALTEKNLQILLSPKERERHPIYDRLLHTLSICVSSNLLEAERQRQGQKSEQVRVFYLNRWLCLHFDLPLRYGGWRRRTLTELCHWIGGDVSRNGTLV